LPDFRIFLSSAIQVHHGVTFTLLRPELAVSGLCGRRVRQLNSRLFRCSAVGLKYAIPSVALASVNGGEKPWRLAGSGGRLNRAAPKCSVVDFVSRRKAVIMAGFWVKDLEGDK